MKNIIQLCTVLIFLFSAQVMARYEVIEWHDQNGKVFIEKADYGRATFGNPLCSAASIKECRVFFVSFSSGSPSAGSGVTIATNAKLTDTQYATALATFSGKLLALPSEQGLCIWVYALEKGGSASMDRQNCGPNGGIPPTVPVVPQCSVYGGPVEINYGDIEAGAAPGLKKTENLTISCDADVTVKVSLPGYDATNGIKLRPDNSLNASVLVRNNPAKTGSLEKVSANQIVTVPISSELKVNGELAGGAFSGSAVISVDIQ